LVKTTHERAAHDIAAPFVSTWPTFRPDVAFRPVLPDWLCGASGAPLSAPPLLAIPESVTKVRLGGCHPEGAGSNRRPRSLLGSVAEGLAARTVCRTIAVRSPSFDLVQNCLALHHASACARLPAASTGNCAVMTP
jgi:hypothetical protein